MIGLSFGVDLLRIVDWPIALPKMTRISEENDRSAQSKEEDRAKAQDLKRTDRSSRLSERKAFDVR